MRFATGRGHCTGYTIAGSNGSDRSCLNLLLARFGRRSNGRSDCLVHRTKVIEIRAIADDGTHSGYFSDPSLAAASAELLDLPTVHGVYLPGLLFIWGRVLDHMYTLIQFKPLFPGNACLPKDPEEKISTNLLAVRIWHGEDQCSPYHIRVLSTLVRTLKPVSSKFVN